MENTISDIKISESISNKFAWFTIHYYILAMVVNFAYLYWNNIRVGIICAIIMILVFVDFIFKKSRYIKIIDSKTTLLVIAFIFYNLIMIYIGVLNGYPALIGISEFSNGVLPIIFYFVALNMSNFEEFKFVKSFTYACLFLVLIGIIMYITKPDIYFDYMQRSIIHYHQETYLASPRMHSFVGSVVVGSVACMAFALEINFLISKRKYYRAILSSVILLIGIILTMQRSSWLFAVIAIMLISLSILSDKTKSFRPIIKFGFIIFMLSVIAALIIPNLIEIILNRISLINVDAITERSADWGYVLEQGIATLFGGGLGTGGHRAMFIRDITIRDNNYFKMIYEIGLIGNIMLIGIMISTILKGIFNYRKYAVYVCIVLGILFQSIGSNTLSFQLVTPMFWFAVGRINCKVLNNVNEPDMIDLLPHEYY